MRRVALLAAVGAAALLGSPVASAAPAFTSAAANRAAANASRPNVIVILADDLGYGDVGAYGSKMIRTPNIDRLAADGVRFTSGYVSHPVCAPSRAALLTGRYQQRFGYEFNPVGRDATGGVSLREVLAGQIMKSAGYATGMVGKWHLGTPKGYHPSDRGFDEFFGITGGASNFILNPTPTDHFFTVPGSEAAERTTEAPDPRLAGMTLPERLRFTRAQAPIYRNHAIVEEPEYLTDAFTREGVSFIERHRDQPFFLYLAYNAPHTPLQVTGKYWDRYPAVSDPATRIYAAMVAALDDGVGAIVAKLKATGLDRNTAIVFLSDNGCAGYIGAACSNAPLSGFKGLPLEGGVRVPFILRWPGRVPAGRVDDRQVSSLDLLPTAAALAGATLPKDRAYDGVDLIPYVTGRKAGVPNPTLFWRAGVNYAVRDGRWKMLVTNRAPVSAGDGRRAAAITPDGVQAKIGPEGQHVMLYDLQSDLAERRNLATSDAAEAARLRAKLSAWDKGLTRPGWTSRRQSTFRWDDQLLQIFN